MDKPFNYFTDAVDPVYSITCRINLYLLALLSYRYQGDSYLNSNKAKIKTINKGNRKPSSNNMNTGSRQSKTPSHDEATYIFSGGNRIQYLENLTVHQLELYNWCEDKVTTLATMDAILLSGATLFVEHVKTGNFPTRTATDWLSTILSWIEKSFPLIMVILIILPIFVSLGITLFHVIPKMRSGATVNTYKNHRSSAGIQRFNSKEEYKHRLDTISVDELYQDLIWQIYGMNKNVWKNQKSIRAAVICDLLGLFGFFFVVLYLVFNGNGSTIF